MQISTSVTLDPGDAFTKTADEAAALVLAALEGDPSNDYSIFHLTSATSGTAGTPPGEPGR